jgi:hypothetical protein
MVMSALFSSIPFLYLLYSIYLVHTLTMSLISPFLFGRDFSFFRYDLCTICTHTIHTILAAVSCSSWGDVWWVDELMQIL